MKNVQSAIGSGIDENNVVEAKKSLYKT